MRNFRYRRTLRLRPSYPEVSPDYPIPQLAIGANDVPVAPPEIEMPKLEKEKMPGKYPLLPTREHIFALSPQASFYNDADKRRWLDHRRQYEGRALALGLHTRKRFISRVDDEWTFEGFVVDRDGFTGWKPYQVFWDGVGDPWDLGLPDPSTAGGSPYAVQTYTWAVFFLVNGTFDDVWIPLPDSSWPYGLEWWDYPVL